MDKFTLTVSLGNDAMQTGADVAELLRRLAGKLDDYSFAKVDGGKMRDLNGNTVAEWEIS